MRPGRAVRYTLGRLSPAAPAQHPVAQWKRRVLQLFAILADVNTRLQARTLAGWWQAVRDRSGDRRRCTPDTRRQ